MNTKEFIKVSGNLDLVLTDEFGNIKDSKSVHNLVVTAGKNWITSRLKDTGSPAQMTLMAVGNSTVDPAITDTALGGELGRVSLTTAGGVVTSNTVTYAATFPAGTGTGALTEAGIFNSANTMLCRTEYGVVTKGVGDSLAVTWVLTIS